MKNKTGRSEEKLSGVVPTKIAKAPDNIIRREAIKRIAYLAAGGLAGSFLASCTKPEDDYSSYSSYNSYSSYASYNSYNVYSSYSSYSNYSNYSNYYHAYNDYYNYYYNYYVVSW